MTAIRKGLASTVTMLLLLAVSAAPARANLFDWLYQPDPVLDDRPAETPGTGAFDRASLETYVDGVVTTAMEDHRIAGVTVSIVDRDGVLLEKGYGVANAETGERVDPARHLFRVASITKTFTATAIMQLVEAGKIDLDADIRTYLGDLAFDDSRGPVTVAHLLSHTPGFEDLLLGYYSVVPALEGRPVEEQLVSMVPEQVRDPGTITSYSNYGYALLGHIVTEVAGIPYADYVHRNVLAPLGMTQSSLHLRFTDPKDDDAGLARLRADAAWSHHWQEGWYVPRDFGHSLRMRAPAGQLAASAGAMGRYMRAWLNDGRLDGARILEPETVARMRSTLFANAPEVDANAYGFWKTVIAGHDTYGHSGSITDFLSMMTIAPDLGLGIFVSTNSFSGARLTALPRRIIEQFFADTPAPLPPPPADFADRAERYTGSYLPTRRNESRMGKLAIVGLGPITVSATADDYLVLSGAGASQRYVEVAPDVFASLRTGRRIRFKGDADGKATQVAQSFGAGALERAEPFESRAAFLVPTAAVVLVSVGVLAALVLRFNKGGTPPRTGAQRLAQWALILAALAWLGFLLLFAQGMVAVVQDQSLIYAPWPSPTFYRGLVLALAGTGLTVACIVLLVPVWRSGGWPLGWRLRYTGATAVFALFVWTLYDWNVLKYWL